MPMSRTVATLLCAGVFSTPSAGLAQRLPTFPVEIGLDSGTRDFLDKLPTRMREEFEKAVKSAMAVIDRSVDEYVKAVHKAAVDTVVTITCTSQGEIINVADDFKKGLAGLLLPGPISMLFNSEAGGPPGPSQDFLGKLRAKRNSFTSNSDPESIFAAYNDLAFSAAKIICRQQSLRADTSFIDAEIPKIRKAQGEWQYLSDHCSDPDDCVTKRKASITKLLATESPGIVEAAGAQAAFKDVENTEDSNLARRLRKLQAA